MNRQMKPWVYLLLIALGAAALTFGIIEKTKSQSCLPTEAAITRIESHYDMTDDRTDYDVFVTYTVDGKVYQDARLGYYEPGYEEGKTITVLYNPANPAQITGAAPAFTLYLLIAGPILILCGLLPLMSALVKKKKAA